MFCWRPFLIHWKPNPSPNSHKTEQLSTLSQVLTDTTSSDKTRNENGQISNKKKTSIVFLKSQSPAPKTSLSRLHCACVISISSPDQFRLKKTRCQFYFYKKKPQIKYQKRTEDREKYPVLSDSLSLSKKAQIHFNFNSCAFHGPQVGKILL